MFVINLNPKILKLTNAKKFAVFVNPYIYQFMSVNTNFQDELKVEKLFDLSDISL